MEDIKLAQKAKIWQNLNIISHQRNTDKTTIDNYTSSYIVKVVNQPCIKLVKVKVTQSCLTLWDPKDFTVHGILQARILERVASPFSRGSSQPTDRTQVSQIAGRFFIIWDTREAHIKLAGGLKDKSSKITFIHSK